MNKNRGKLIRVCDHLCSLLTAHGFLHRCIMCGLPGSDTHHWRYIRSILVYRWDLENLVYMCRVCHNEAERNHMPLYLKIKADYPRLWNWYLIQPPLVSRPISTWQIKDILAGLQRTADALGVKYEQH